MIEKAINYIQKSFEEMKKVTWPTQKQAKSYTILVISISLIVAVFLGSLDMMFQAIIKTFY